MTNPGSDSMSQNKLFEVLLPTRSTRKKNARLKSTLNRAQTSNLTNLPLHHESQLPTPTQPTSASGR